MGKARAKDVKKRLGSDFKRKTAKVGMKVSRGNVTKISVVSKRIVLPLQASLAANKDETANIDGLIRLMQHYSSKNRAAALAELQDIFETSPNARKYIGITLPHVLELLFDGTAEVHKAMLDLLSSLLTNYTANDFSSLVPVLVTYICSGLTSLNLAIRKDTLVTLHLIATLQPPLLAVYIDKIFEHLLTLIEGSLAESGTKDSFSSGVDEIANASAQVTQKLSNVVVVKRKKQESAIKQMVQRKIHDNNLLVLSLKIFVSLLSNGQTTTETDNDTDTESVANDQHTMGHVRLRSCRRDSMLLTSSLGSVSSSASSSTMMDVDGAAAELLRAHYLQVESANTGVDAPSRSSSTSVPTLPSSCAGSGTGGSISLNSPVLPKLCSLLRRIWVGYLPHDASPLPLKLETILRGMADVMAVLSRLIVSHISGNGTGMQTPPIIINELRRTAHSFASQFPYTVLESSCSAEIGKKKVKQQQVAVAVAAFEAQSEVLMDMDVQEEGEVAIRNNDSGSDNDSEDISIGDDESVATTATTSSKTTVVYQGAIDEGILMDAKKRFLNLNIILSETVINLYAESVCLDYLSMAPKQRVDILAYLKAYGTVQQFIRRELSTVIPLLDNVSDISSRDYDLTPKEFYQNLFVCHKLSYMQLNKVISLNIPDSDLAVIHPGIIVNSTFNLPNCLSTLLASFLRLGISFRCKGYIPFMEACVECICGVAEETVLHRSFEIESAVDSSIVSDSMAIDNPSETSSADIITGLSAALSLMGALLNEPSRLTRMLTDSAVRFMGIVDCNCLSGNSTATSALALALRKLQTAVLQLFCSSDEDEDSVPLYNRAVQSTRMRMLDLWVVVAPADADFMSGVEDIFECLKGSVYEAAAEEDASHGAPCASEIGYFLRLFHMRRHDASLSAFKEFVLSSIEAICSTYRDVVIETTEKFISNQPLTRVSVASLHEHLFKIMGNCSDAVREIVLALVRCSSPQYPEKLLAMLSVPIAGMISVLEETDNRSSSNSLETQSRTVLLFASSVDIITLNTVLSTLLACCSMSGGDSSDGGDTTNRQFIDLTAHALYSSLALLQKVNNTSPTPLDVFSTGPSVPIPLSASSLFFSDAMGCMDLMALAVPTATTSDESIGSTSTEMIFAVFNALVREIEFKWSSLTFTDTKLNIFRTINEFYRRREFDTSMLASRKVIETFLENLKNVETNSDVLAASEELYRFVAA